MIKLKKLRMKGWNWSAEGVRRVWKCQPVFFSPVRNPANVPSVCNGRRQRPCDPTYVLADLPVEIRWLDSKPKLFAPGGVQASVPHSNRGPNAVYIRFLTMFLPLLQTSSLEPDYSNCGHHRAIPTTDLYLKVVPRWNGIVSEMKHPDSQGDLCIHAS